MTANVVGVAEMILILHTDCCNTRKLAEKTGLHHSTVVRYIKLFHSRKLVRIAEWHQFSKNRTWVPSYEWNTDYEKDAIKPTRKTDAERQKDYKQRKQQTKIPTALISKGSLLI